jgi:hypothetical protein
MGTGACHPGKATNTSSNASTLVCGRNATSITNHVSSSAQKMFDLPRMFVQFGNETSQ